jgi:hypothetical protein
MEFPHSINEVTVLATNGLTTFVETPVTGPVSRRGKVNQQPLLGKKDRGAGFHFHDACPYLRQKPGKGTRAG